MGFKNYILNLDLGNFLNEKDYFYKAFLEL